MNNYKELRDEFGQKLITAIRDNRVIEAYTLVDLVMDAQRRFALQEAKECVPGKKEIPDSLEAPYREYPLGFNQCRAQFLAALDKLTD